MPEVIQTLTDIATPGNARPWLTDALAAHRTIPGFARHTSAYNGPPNAA